MNKLSKDNIEKATERVMKRLPIDKLRLIPRFKGITQKDYIKLIKNAERLALLILDIYATK